ncbi:MAG: 4-oxalomesaconate tautomerase [Alphaproteobacteria bacterium]|nr:MAG: 4-oxalomesaconate tautomerase [Alphaproteobacteria bacterium]
MLMRGGTSKGPYFLKSDLPEDTSARDALLCTVLGSPDSRQIDGVGGGHPLTSKVAVVSPSDHEDCDVDYLFLQVTPDTGAVSDAQNCGNILAGVGPFAIERGLVKATAPETTVRVYMVNSDARADLVVQTPDGRVNYEGYTRIDGVPGRHAPIIQNYFGTAGAQCGALLPTGNPTDVIEGVPCTLVDNGMPSVLIRAESLGVTGYETPAELEENTTLRDKVEAIRLKAGPMMGLGNVGPKTVPKMCLISPPRHGGLINTRTFIPHRVHETLGVLAAASDAAACMIEGSVGHDIAHLEPSNPCRVDVEHPSGALTVELEWENGTVIRTALIRTARKLMDGVVFPHKGAGQ